MKRKLLSLVLCLSMLMTLTVNMVISRADDGHSPIPGAKTLVWFDASSPGALVTDSNGLVSEWKDISGNNHHATQSDAAFRPAVKTNAINGKPALVFENSIKGSNKYKTGQYLSFTDVDLNSEVESNISIIVVSKAKCALPLYRSDNQNINSANVIHFGETGNWGSTFLGVYTDKLTMRWGGNDSGRGWEYSRKELNNDFSYTYAIKDRNSELFYVDGKQIPLSDPDLKYYYGNNIDTGIGARNNMRITSAVSRTSTTGEIGRGFTKFSNGSELTGDALNGVYFEGEIAEIIIFDKALSKDDIKNLNEYFENKYNIAYQYGKGTVPAPEKVEVWYDLSTESGVVKDASNKVSKLIDKS